MANKGRAKELQAIHGKIMCRTGSSRNPAYNGFNPITVADAHDKRIEAPQKQDNNKTIEEDNQ